MLFEKYYLPSFQILLHLKKDESNNFLFITKIENIEITILNFKYIVVICCITTRQKDKSMLKGCE